VGAGESRERAAERSLRSEWIFWFPCFVREWNPFLWNGRLHSFIPNGKSCFLSYHSCTHEIPTLFPCSKRGLKLQPDARLFPVVDELQILGAGRGQRYVAARRLSSVCWKKGAARRRISSSCYQSSEGGVQRDCNQTLYWRLCLLIFVCLCSRLDVNKVDAPLFIDLRVRTLC